MSKIEVKKVYEALRYSDYVSTPELVGVETNIKNNLELLKIAVDNEDLEDVQKNTKELLLLIKDRNNKNKIQK